MVDHQHPSLSVARRCALLEISRSGSAEDLALMKLIDRQYLDTPFYGARRMTVWLKSHGHQVNRKRVRRLMRIMGLKTIYRRPWTSKAAPRRKIYPYLLNNTVITRPNQVWAADITYIPMVRGFLYLAAVIDWYSRSVLSWQLSNTLDADFCIDALKEALWKGQPDIFNTDQGAQFTAKNSPGCWTHMASGSAWMGKAATGITCSSNGCSEQSNTKRCTRKHTAMAEKPEPGSVSISVSITVSGPTRPSVTGHQVTYTTQ